MGCVVIAGAGGNCMTIVWQHVLVLAAASVASHVRAMIRALVPVMLVVVLSTVSVTGPQLSEAVGLLKLQELSGLVFEKQARWRLSAQ